MHSRNIYSIMDYRYFLVVHDSIHKHLLITMIYSIISFVIIDDNDEPN